MYVGLPTKTRGKYQKRRLLTEEQRLEALRATNRENARLTRKRKKIYNEVITCLLTTLHQVLGSEAVKKSIDITSLGPDSTLNHILESTTRASENISSKRARGRPRKDTKDSCGSVISSVSSSDMVPKGLTEGSIESLLRDVRQDQISQYLSFRSNRNTPFHSFSQLSLESSNDGFVRIQSSTSRTDSSSPSEGASTTTALVNDATNASISDVIDQWNSCCSPNMTHIMPVPSFRSLSSLGQCEDGRYRCEGLSSILDDCYNAISFFQWVVQHLYPSGTTQESWFVSSSFVPNSFVAKGRCELVTFEYKLSLLAEESLSPLLDTESNDDDKGVSSTPFPTSENVLSATDEFSSSSSFRNCEASSEAEAEDDEVEIFDDKDNTLSSKSEVNVDDNSCKSNHDNNQSVINFTTLNSSKKYQKILEITSSARVSFGSDGRILLFVEEFDALQIQLIKEKLLEKFERMVNRNESPY